LHEPDSSLGPPKTEVSLCDDFEPDNLVRYDLYNVKSLPSL